MVSLRCVLLVTFLTITLFWTAECDPVSSVHASEYIHGNYATNIKDQCIRICRYYVNPYGCIVYCVLNFEYFKFWCARLVPPPPESCAVLQNNFNKPAAAKCGTETIIWDCVVQFYENGQRECTHDFSTCLSSSAMSSSRRAKVNKVKRATENTELCSDDATRLPSATVTVTDDNGNTESLLHVPTGITYIFGSVLNIQKIGFTHFSSRYHQGYLAPGPFFRGWYRRKCRGFAVSPRRRARPRAKIGRQKA